MESKRLTPGPLLVIGGGNMGRAIVLGAIAAGALRGDRVVVVEPDTGKHAAFEEHGVACFASAGEGLAGFLALEAEAGPGGVLVAVKPQMLDGVGEQFGGPLRSPGRLVMSVLAGVTTTRLGGALGGRVVRLMPNTPALIGRGITAMCGGAGVSGADLAGARRLFESVGRVIDLPEDLLDAFTGVAGSGPAYLFYLAEGMVAGAQRVGFPRDQAVEIVRATVAGAAALLESQTDLEPGALRAMVTSKGGTTAAATALLDERGVAGAVADAVVAARDRGRELAGG